MKKRIMLKLERKWEMKKVEKSENNEANMYKWSGVKRVGRGGDIIYTNERRVKG